MPPSRAQHPSDDITMHGQRVIQECSGCCYSRHNSTALRGYIGCRLEKHIFGFKDAVNKVGHLTFKHPTQLFEIRFDLYAVQFVYRLQRVCNWLAVFSKNLVYSKHMALDKCLILCGHYNKEACLSR